MKIKALTVEDNEPFRKCIADILENEGYETFASGIAEEAKEIYKTHKPQIVLLDIMLPDGSGYDLIDFFRETSDSRILMLTALDDHESERISYENGADDYIMKPFDLDELIYKLAAVRRRILSDQKQYEIGIMNTRTKTHGQNRCHRLL